MFFLTGTSSCSRWGRERVAKKQLLIVCHSQSGATAMLARALQRGARRERSVDTRLKCTYDTSTDDLEAATAVIFATPENLGTMSGGLKDFFDRTYYPAQALALVLPYALVVSAGNDGSGAVRDVERVLLGYPMKKIAEAKIIRGVPDESSLSDCADLGQSVAAGIQMGIF